MRNTRHWLTRNPETLLHSTLQSEIDASAFRKELQHRAIISYIVPRARIKGLIPVEFGLAEMTLLSVESFLDCGRVSFEQTNYRFHVTLKGKACSWLLGTSLGSLSGIAARHLYPLPWHLSAMELQVAFDPAREKYTRYHLTTQSRWANAKWEIADTGAPLLVERQTEVTDYFVRRDGKLGSYQTRYKAAPAARGKLKAARCDLLASLGILTNEELKHPISVVLQRAVSCEIKPAVYSLSVRATV